MKRADWILRPILWFTTASTIQVVVHEGAHALMAFALGVPNTLYQYWDEWPPGAATPGQEALARVWGPIFSLIAGLGFWFVYRRRSRSAAGLPLLYLSAMGVAMFFGNLMSAAFVGDFSGVSRYLSLSMSVRYALSAVGAVGASIVMFWFGRELRRWIPGHVSRAFGVVGVAVLPVIAGTALIVLINQPVPASINFVPGRITEQSFQIFAIIGAATGARPTANTSLQLRWIDGVIAVAVVLIVRVMTMGIHLNA